MTANNKNQLKIYRCVFLVTTVILILSLATGCDSSNQLQAYKDFAPLVRADWEVSTPRTEGLDPKMVAKLYKNASKLDTIFSVLVIKNGKLIAEDYFNDGTIEQKVLLQSVSKSFISTLVGLALEEGCIESINQRLLDFFPEYALQIMDPRKLDITLQHMLQMRSGLPWEETHPDLMAAMWKGDNPPLVVGFPLTEDPGTVFQYSNITPALLAEIISRTCDTNLKDFSQENLAEPLGVEFGEFWPNEYDDYHPLFHLSARDLAKYGQMYLDDGEFNGQQIVPMEWIQASLESYSENVSTGAPQNGKMGRYFRDIGYGYQWWNARVGDHYFNYAAGHGGQLIILLHDLDMVIVTTAEPFFMQHDGKSWKHEKAIINMVGEFIDSLPIE